MRVRKDSTGNWFITELSSIEQGEIAQLAVRNRVMMESMIEQVLQTGLAYIRNVESSKAEEVAA